MTSTTSSFAFQATRILTRNRIGPDRSETTSEGGFRNVRFREPDSPAPSGRWAERTRFMRFHQKNATICQWIVDAWADISTQASMCCSSCANKGLFLLASTNGHLPNRTRPQRNSNETLLLSFPMTLVRLPWIPEIGGPGRVRWIQRYPVSLPQSGSRSLIRVRARSPHPTRGSSYVLHCPL